MTLITWVSWGFPLVVVAYLVVLVSFVSMMRRDYHEYWKSIGSPGLWEPNGQAAILKRVFLPRQLPAQIATRHGLWLKSIRILAALGVALFLTVLLMIWLGMFDGNGGG